MIKLLLFCLNLQAGFDSEIRDQLKWENVGIAKALSDIGQITMLTTPFIIAGMNKENRKENLLSSALAFGSDKIVTGAIKYFSHRERPDKSNFLSFPSGHTSSSFTGAALICKMSDKYTCAGGLLIATAVGYLRIAGDRHWFSDVAIGMGLGVAHGVLYPKLVYSW